MRKVARETLFKIVFSSQFNETSQGFKNALYKSDKLDGDDIEYCDAMLELIAAHSGEFAEILDGRSRLFPESRIFPADKSALFVALAEIYYRPDIPDAVSVNEAADIAAKYSSEKSASFVNGILAEIIREKNNV